MKRMSANVVVHIPSNLLLVEALWPCVSRYTKKLLLRMIQTRRRTSLSGLGSRAVRKKELSDIRTRTESRCFVTKTSFLGRSLPSRTRYTRTIALPSVGILTRARAEHPLGQTGGFCLVDTAGHPPRRHEDGDRGAVDTKPSTPLLSYTTDLSADVGGGQTYVGLTRPFSLSPNRKLGPERIGSTSGSTRPRWPGDKCRASNTRAPSREPGNSFPQAYVTTVLPEVKLGIGKVRPLGRREDDVGHLHCHQKGADGCECPLHYRPVPRLHPRLPSRETTGLIEAMALYAGESVDRVRAVQPAAQIVHELADDAELLLRRWC
jgi:hypothetical protein